MSNRYVEMGLSAPVNVTWEVTYACNLSCIHCLSDSGRKREGEMTTEQALRVIDQLSTLKVFQFNIGGGEIVSLIDALRILEEITGKTAQISHAPGRPGDQKHTAANTEKAQRILGYAPTTSVKSGLQAQVEWQKRQG